MEKGEETGRIQAAAVAKARTDEMIVVRRDRLQNVQHGDWIIEHLIGATNQPGGIQKVTLFDKCARASQFPSDALQHQFLTLMYYLERHLIFMKEFFRRLLQG